MGKMGHPQGQHNVTEEYAAAMEELVENLTEHHPKQLEALIEANNDNMAKLMELLGKAAPTAAAQPQASQKPNVMQKSTSGGLRSARRRQNANIATRFIQIVPRPNAGNWKKMHPNAGQTGNPSSRVDGAPGSQ